VKGYYIVFSPPPDNNGIGLKIKAQVKTFNDYGIETKILSIYREETFMGRIYKKFNQKYFYKFLPSDFFSQDFYFIRNYTLSFPFFGLLKLFRQKNKANIILELPTYPYDRELMDSLSNIFTLFIEKIIRISLNKYIDRIITYSTDTVIFGIPTIKIINGIVCSDVPKRIPKSSHKGLTFIAVARFEKWHGYDRLIKGLYNYKKQSKQDVYIYLVGDGNELDLYKRLIKEYNLSGNVFTTGFLTGEALTEVYNKADIAVSSLGCHRIGLYLGSFLKSREYLARGFPIVSSTKIDVLPDDYKYCLYVPEDETPVDIQSIVDFINDLTSKQDSSELITEIRSFAEKYCDMSITLKPVIDYIKSATLDS
jgi:glycosyltransferase involved in cell wall biosynthesis